MAPVPDLGPPGKRPAHQGEALEVRPGFLLLLVERENFSEELLDDKGPHVKVGINQRATERPKREFQPTTGGALHSSLGGRAGGRE